MTCRVAASFSKKISPQDLDLLRQQLREELAQAVSRGAKIIYLHNGLRMLPDALVARVLQAVVATWATKAIEERGVLRNDIQLFSDAVIQQTLVDELDYPVALSYLKEKAELVDKNLQRLYELPNSQIVRDPETGLTIADLQRSLQDMLGYRLQMLEDPIQQLGISRTPKMTRLHYEEERVRLMEQQRVLQQKAAVIVLAQQQYHGEQRGGAVSSGVAIAEATSTLSASPVGTTIPQFGDTFLDRIIGLSDHASDTAYRQKLSDQRLQFEQQAIELEQGIRVVERSIRQIEQQQDGQERDMQQEAITVLQRGIPDLVEALKGYIAATSRIYQQLNRQTLYGHGGLYRLVSEAPIRSGGQFHFPARSRLMYLLSLLLTTFVVVPLAMVRNSMRRRKEEVASAAG